MIRVAELADLPFIVEAGLKFVSAGTYSAEVADKDHLASVAETALLDPSGVVAVLKEGKDFGGCYVGGVVKNFITGRSMLFEIFLWVEPEFRGNGRALMTFAEGLARSKGATSSMLSHPVEATHAGKAFTRWGYDLTELHYRKAL